MPKLTDPAVQEAVIKLAIAAGTYNDPSFAERQLRKWPPEERALLVIERLSTKLRESQRDRRERPVQPVEEGS